MNDGLQIDKPDIEQLVPDHIRRFEAYVPSKPDDVLMKMSGCARLFRSCPPASVCIRTSFS